MKQTDDEKMIIEAWNAFEYWFNGNGESFDPLPYIQILFNVKNEVKQDVTFDDLEKIEYIRTIMSPFMSAYFIGKGIKHPDLNMGEIVEIIINSKKPKLRLVH